MKKYFKALFVALAAAVLFAALGLAACGDKNRYNISVSCGDGGEYSLSHENPVPENTQVTLTVTPDDGYTVGDVLIDNSKVSLIGNKYIFTVTKDVSISISFESESAAPEEPDEPDIPDKPEPPATYNIVVNCGYGGNYELSKQAPYTLGDEVTLTVTPSENHTVKSVTVNGADVTEELVGGKYTFTLSANVEISIEFSVVLTRDAYIGTWKAVTSSDMLANELVIGEDSFTFNEKSYTLTPTENGYSFTVTEGEDVYQYSFTLEEVGEGKFLLILTIIMPDSSKTVQTCTKEGVNYSVDFPEELWGDWDAGASRYPISIGEDGLTIAGDTAIVHSYDASTKTYKLLAGGTEYTLVWNAAKETLTLTIVGEASSASVYTKAIPPEETLFTQFAGNYYTNGEHNVQIGDDGAFSFDGTTYSVLPVDSTDLSFGYTFRKNGDLWHIITASAEQFLITDASYSDEIVCRYVTGDEAYTITVTYTGGENGTCNITPPVKGGTTYAAYELVTVTITANTGYHLQQVYLNGGSDITEEFEDGSYTFYISRNTTIEIKFISEQVAESIFPTAYIGRIYYGDDENVFSIKFEYDKVTLTIESTQYVIAADDVTVTDSAVVTFTFNVTIEKYGVVTVQCNASSGIARFTVKKADGTLLGSTYTGKLVT